MPIDLETQKLDSFYESYHWTTKVLTLGWIRTNIPALTELKIFAV
jgi:hypothetical protein